MITVGDYLWTQLFPVKFNWVWSFLSVIIYLLTKSFLISSRVSELGGGCFMPSRSYKKHPWALETGLIVEVCA
jgi:hypothetical protein